MFFSNELKRKVLVNCNVQDVVAQSLWSVRPTESWPHFCLAVSIVRAFVGCVCCDGGRAVSVDCLSHRVVTPSLWWMFVRVCDLHTS